MPSVSYSGLGLYDKCPRSFYDKYYRGVKGEDVKTPAMSRGSRLHGIAEDYVRGDLVSLPKELQEKQKFLDRLVKLNALPELEFNITRDWQCIPFEDVDGGNVRGVIDCVCPTGEVLEIYEYKTGKVYDSHADQRSLYSLAGLLLYPQALLVRTTTVYFDLAGADKTLEVPRERLPVLKMVWEKRINRTRPPQEYVARPGKHCTYCPSNQSNGGTCAAGKEYRKKVR